jgi:hypothetical protein
MQEADDADGSKLISLCEQGKADEVKLLLRQHPFLVSFVDVRGKTPLVGAFGGNCSNFFFFEANPTCSSFCLSSCLCVAGERS